MPVNLKKPSRPKSYAPGFHVESAHTASKGQAEPCPGCLHDPYVRERGCSCCLSEEVDRVLVAGQHLMPLCARCYAVVLQARAESEAEKLARRKGAKRGRPTPKAKAGAA